MYVYIYKYLYIYIYIYIYILKLIVKVYDINYMTDDNPGLLV